MRRPAAPVSRTPSSPWFVYVVRCADGTLYTGIALNVPDRLAQHEAGRGARYTNGRGPLELCAVRRCKTKGDALRLEHAVKRLNRKEKERLIAKGAKETSGKAGARRLGVLARGLLSG